MCSLLSICARHIHVSSFCGTSRLCVYHRSGGVCFTMQHDIHHVLFFFLSGWTWWLGSLRFCRAQIAQTCKQSCLRKLYFVLWTSNFATGIEMKITSKAEQKLMANDHFTKLAGRFLDIYNFYDRLYMWCMCINKKVLGTKIPQFQVSPNHHDLAWESCGNCHNQSIPSCYGQRAKLCQLIWTMAEIFHSMEHRRT